MAYLIPFLIWPSIYQIINIIYWIYQCICHALNINLQIPNICSSEKSAFEPGVLFLRERGLFFELVIFLRFRPSPYTRMCESTIGSFSLFGKIFKNPGKTQIRSWFFGTPWNLGFSVYFDYLSRITFWGWGTTSRSLRCSNEQVPVGGGGPLPGPWGVWRYMYIVRYCVPTYLPIISVYSWSKMFVNKPSIILANSY